MKILVATALAAAGLALSSPAALAGNDSDFVPTQWTQSHPLPVMPGGNAYGPEADRFFAEQSVQPTVSGNQEQNNEMRATTSHRHIKRLSH